MNLVKRLYPYIRPYWKGYLLGLLMVVLANGFAILAPRLLGQAIDALEQTGVTHAVVWRYAGLILLVAVLAGAARYGMRELLNGYSRRVETDLRQDFFAHLMRLDAAFYGQWRTGDLMSRATNDILSVRMAVGPAIMYTVNTLVLGALALVFMLNVSPVLTALRAHPADPAAPRHALFREGHPPEVREDPGAPGGAHHDGPGKPVGREDRPRLHPGGRAG